jgi:hypothetical protein
MPQVMIDTSTDTAEELLATAAFLSALARLAPAAGSDGIKRPAPPPILPAPLHPAASPPVLPPGNVPPAPVSHPDVHPDAQLTVPSVPAGTFGQTFSDPQAFQLPTMAEMIAAVAATNAATATVQATSTETPILAPVPAPPVTQAVLLPPALTDTHDGERDSENLPWDARIHSETKKKNADGTWRFRRGLDETVKHTVYGELVATYGKAAQLSAMPAPATGAAVPPQPPVPPAPVPAEPTAAQAFGGAPPPPPIPTATVLPFPQQHSATVPVPPAPNVGVPDATQSPVVQTFRGLMQRVNVALSQNQLTQAQLSEACKANGLDSITALAAQPMLVQAVNDYLNRFITSNVA